VLFNCVQRCQSFVTAVVSGCVPVVSPMFEKRLMSLPYEQQPRTSHLRADADPCIVECLFFSFAFAMFKTQKLHYLCIYFITKKFM
jgi:hypothetical protein